MQFSCPKHKLQNVTVLWPSNMPDLADIMKNGGCGTFACDPGCTNIRIMRAKSLAPGDFLRQFPDGKFPAVR